MAESKNQEELNKGHTLLHLAAMTNKNIDVTDFLIKSGISVNVTNKEHQQTPLHVSIIFNKNLGVTEFLIKSGASVNATYKLGLTSLHTAAALSNEVSVAVFDLLIQSGADIYAKSNTGETPLDFVKRMGNKKDVIALIQSYMSGEKKVNGHALLQQPFGTILDSQSTYRSYDMRIMVVGKYGVGKTTLVMLLIGEDIPKSRLPTDGISLFEGRCGLDIESKEWVIINKNSYKVKDVLYNRMLMTKSGNDAEGNVMTKAEHQQSEKKIVTHPQPTKHRVSQPLKTKHPVSQDTVPKDNVENVQGKVDGLNKEINSANEESIRQLTKSKVKTKLSKIEFRKRLQEALKNGTYKMLMGRLIFWDFGGQYVYYTTHQTFMTYRALFVVVFDGSKDLHELCPDEEHIPGQQGTASSAMFLQHWVNSILTYCEIISEDVPKILFVATHKDEILQELVEERRKLVFDTVDRLFQDHQGRNHLVLEHRIFVNAKDKNDPEIVDLKKIITELTFSHPCWGEKMPNAWVPLELEIAELVASRTQIISLRQLDDLNKASQVSVLSQKDLRSFLLIQHSLGKIVYFDTPQLRDFVIISPLYMVEVMKSFVTDKHFWPTDPKGKATFKMMSVHGIVKKDELFLLWKRKQFSKIFPYREFVYEMLVHLDIVSEQRRYDMKTGSRLPVENLFVPCMLTRRNTTDYLQQEYVHRQAIGIAFEFKATIVPPALPNRLISACLNIWALKNYKSTMMLFSGLVVLTYDKSHEIVVCIESNRILLFVVHKRSKGLIVRDVATSIRECIYTSLERISDFYQRSVSGESSVQKLPFRVQHACPELQCYLPATDLLNNKNLACKGHGEKYEIDVWYQNKAKQICENNCKGLSEDAICKIPSDPELLRLSLQFDFETMYKLVIHLGITAREWIDMKQNHPHSIEIVKFLTLIKWREQTKGSFKDILKALRNMEEDTHTLCQVRRTKIRKSDIQEEHLGSIPTDEILDALAPQIGLLSFQLGVELGRQVTELETIQYNHKLDLVAQSREILQNWRNEKTVKATIGVLEQALVNVGRGSLCLKTVVDEIGVKQHDFSHMKEKSLGTQTSKACSLM